jgi:glycosyltransferase involved in cell wall biosynthesis
MEVSVIIPTYNSAHFLPDALESVIRQTSLSPSSQILVIDDGSNDTTAAVSAEYARSFPIIRYIKTDHRGASHARNVGIQNASNSFLAFLDADDIWLPSKLATQECEFAKDPDLVFCTCFGLTFFEPPGALGFSGIAGLGALEPLSTIPLPSGWVLKREGIESCGLFDESLTIAHDFDFFLRAKQKELVWRAMPEALYKRRIHRHNISHNFETNRSEIFQVLHSGAMRLKGNQREYQKRHH